MSGWTDIVVVGAGLAFLGVVPSAAVAKTSGYCLECHSQKFADRVSRGSIGEDRSVYQARLESCPGVRSLAEEVFFTESRIFRLDRILNTLENQEGARTRLKERVSDTADSFLDLKSGKKVSIGEFGREASTLRTALQKIYDRTLQARNESDRRFLIGLGCLVFLGILILLGIGYRKLNRMEKTLLLFLSVGGSLFLNACSYGPAETEKKSPAQEQLDQALSAAAQTSRQMDETFYQAVLLAQMARDWSKVEPGPAEKAFQLAWQMALAAREKAGKNQGLREIASRWPDQREAQKGKVNFDTILDLRDELRSSDGRIWALRAIAEEWSQAEPKKGRSALEWVAQEAVNIKDAELRDQELAAIAGAWASVNKNRTSEIARLIHAPFLKAMALAEASMSTSQLAEAWQAAESISGEYPQIKAFIRLSAAGARMDPAEKNTWAEKIFSKVRNVKNPQMQAFAMQKLVGEWSAVDRGQAERWAAAISNNFPAVRGYAFIFLAERSAKIPSGKALAALKEALVEAGKVEDSYEAQKIQSLALQKMAELDPREAVLGLSQVRDPFFRSVILAHLAGQFSRQNKGTALDLADKIPFEALRFKTITSIISRWMEDERNKAASLYQEASAAAAHISDPYGKCMSLIELGKKWGRWDRKMETALLESAWKSAKEIPSVALQAEVLEAISGAWRNYDKAKAEAVMESIDPSALRARKSLEEIRLWAQTDPAKARQWAEGMPSAFPLEKAAALREVAGGMKKIKPLPALEILEKALTQTLTLPETPKSQQLLSRIISDSARLDRERTLRILLPVVDREIRDLLLKEAGNIWAPEDSLWAMKAAGNISESSLRLGLLRKIAERQAQKFTLQKSDKAVLAALWQWGRGREKAKNEETEAVPFYEKALQEIEKVADRRDRSYLVCGLTADWALIDEKKALQVAEKISPELPEPLSYAFLQVGTQLGKWNRKEAEAVFQKALTATADIIDPALKAQRMLQLGQQWKVFDRSRGKEVLKKAESEARKVNPRPDKENQVLAEILSARSALEPEEGLAIARSAGTPFLKAKVLMENGESLTQSSIEENIKILDKALEFAQKSKNQRLISEIAVAWSSLETEKALEILGQVENRELRFQALRQMALKGSGPSREETRHFSELAIREAAGMDGLQEKVKCLSQIAGDCQKTDKERAKAIYRKAYQFAQKARLSIPQF